MIAQTGVELGQSTDHDRGGEGGKENYISKVIDKSIKLLTNLQKTKERKGREGEKPGRVDVETKRG